METSNRALVTGITLLVVVILITGACAGGFVAGYFLAPEKSQNAVSQPELPSDNTSAQHSSTDELFKPFWEAWQIVHDQYIDQPVDDTLLMQGAIRGMLDALGDQHSSYMDPNQYRDAQASMEGEYEGIGAWVNTDGEYLTIMEPMKGSPAEAAGLLPGDQVIAIDGEDMTGITPDLARLKVLGPAGTTVVLTIQRESVAEPFDVTVTRASITVPSVEYEILEGNIAYVRLITFGTTSDTELRAALEAVLAQEPVGLIFDLRNNSGGSLTTAINVASEFIQDGVIAYEEYGDGTRDNYNATGKGIATDIPMVVLVNEWSASASELVAGAIQDYGRASLVGTVTFGKGTVQNWIGLSDEQGAIRVTIARWLTPEGRNIHQIGLTPEYEVPISQEELEAELDPQLDKAIELLTQP
ncbi:MAG: S41 family peptidase [Anaerolineales bacterium]|nr:S41 family peptidase [Anaerolineales bacterium]